MEVKRFMVTGDFYYESSSSQYKNEIRDLDAEFKKIFEVCPKTYRDTIYGEKRSAIWPKILSG